MDRAATGGEQVTSAAARSFGWQVVRSELTSLAPNPLRRPLGWAFLVGAVPTAGVIGVWLPARPLPATVAVSYAAALVVVVGLWTLIAPGVEARAFDRADFRWLRADGSGTAGAVATRDRHGRLTLSSVWAHPRGHGLGTHLVDQILDDTAGQGDLWLVAVNRRADLFYRRHGFRPVRRELLGHRMVLRRDDLPDAAGRRTSTQGG